MPPVIAPIAAAIAGGLASAGAITTISGLVMAIEIATFALTTALSVGTSMALSAITSAISGKPKNRSPLGAFQDRTQAVRQPITPRRVIYGRIRVSGVYTFIQSTNKNEYLNLLLTLSGHPLTAIEDVYFGDELIPLDANGRATGKYAGYVEIIKGLGTPAGDALLMGWMTGAATEYTWTHEHRQSGCGKLFVRLRYSSTLFPNGIPNISCIVRGRQIYDPRTGLIDYSDNAALIVRDYVTDGTYGLGDANVGSAAAITAANICDELVGTLTRVGEFTVYRIPPPTAAPTVRTYLYGAPPGLPQGNYLYAVTFVDAGGETVPGPVAAYTSPHYGLQWAEITRIPTGPAGTTARRIYRTAAGGSQLKLLATIGDNTTTTLLDKALDAALGANAPSATTTAVHDDVRVAESTLVLATGTAVALTTTGTLPAGLSSGTYYTIATGNGSYFLATSKADAFGGIHVDITSTGSGTHTMSMSQEIRYTCNGAFDTDAKPREVLGKLLTAMHGRCIYQGGQWNIYAGAYRNPTVTLAEDDLDGPIGVTTRLSRRETFNAVKGIFVNPLDFFQPNDFPPVTNAMYLAEDQGERIWKDIELPFTNSSGMAQRIGKIELESARQQITTVWPCKLTAFRVQAGDVVNLTHARFGWSAKPFEVMEWRFAIRQDKDGPRLGIDLVMRETAPGVYDWNSGEETAIDLAPNTTLPDPFAVSVPGAPAVQEVLYRTSGSAGVKSKAIVTWGASDDSFAATYQLEYRPAQLQDEYLIITEIRGLSAELVDLAPGVYDFRVKAFNAIGVASDYSEETRVTIHGLTAPPAQVQDFSVIASNGYALASWALSPDLDVQINGSVIIRHSSKTSGAAWEDGIILEEFPGGAIQGLVPLITGTYLAKAKDSTGNYSASFSSFVATEGMVTGFNTVATTSQAPAFAGAKTDLTVASSVLRLTDPAAVMTGEYEFDAYVDLGTIKTRRVESDIVALSYVATDLIGSRGLVSTWPMVSGATVDDCDVTLYASTTDDDPAGSPTWGPWTPFFVADMTCRALRFRIVVETGTPSNNIDISTLTVHVKEAV